MKDDHTKVQISKTDIATGVEIKNAALAIYRKNEDGSKGEEIAAWVTDGTPHTIEYMAVGDYILEEVQAPTEDGYVRSEAVNFTVAETGITQKVVMQDDYTKVQFLKLDDKGNPVKDALLALYSLNEDGSTGELTDRWRTDGTAHRMDYLPAGDYILIEEETPSGYLTAESIVFTVKDTEEVQTITMTDTTGSFELPVTGGMGTYIFYGMAVLAALAALAFFIKGKRAGTDEERER